MSGAGVPVTADDIALRGVRRGRRFIGTTPADILLGPRQQNNRVSQRRDAQGGAARRGTAAWLGIFNMPTRLGLGPQRALNRGTAARLGMPSMPMRIARLQRAVRTLIPAFVGGDDGADDDQLEDMMADFARLAA